MISYYKYTTGSEFKYNDNTPYSGVVTVVDSNVYTGSFYTNQSTKLTPTNSLLSECIKRSINFNYSAQSNVEQTLQRIDIYPRSIITQELVTNTIEVLYENNAKLFASSITFDTNFFNQSLREYSEATYATRLTSYNSDPVSVKNVNIDSRIPLKTGPLSAITSTSPTSERSSFVLSENLSSFNYYNNHGLIKGIINSPLPFLFIDGLQPSTDFDHKFVHYDKYNDRIFHTTDNLTYSIFNIDYTNGLPTLNLADTLNLSNASTPISRYTASYGRFFRSVVVLDAGLQYVEIYSLTDSEPLAIISADTLGFTVNSIDCVYQRFEDDIIVITGVKDDSFLIAVYDIEQLLSQNYTPINSYAFNTTLPSFIEFTDFDSDLMVFKYYNSSLNIQKVEIRSISLLGSILSQYTYDSFKYNNTDDRISGSEFSMIPINLNDTILSNLQKADEYIVDIKYITTDKVNSLSILKDSVVCDNFYPYRSIVPQDLIIPNIDNNFALQVNSIGLELNTRFQKVIRDVLMLYYNFSGRYNFNATDIKTVTLVNSLYSINTEDLNIHLNESINTGAINRILKTLLDIQFTLAREIDKRV